MRETFAPVATDGECGTARKWYKPAKARLAEDARYAELRGPWRIVSGRVAGIYCRLISVEALVPEQPGYAVGAMEEAILALLEQHGALAYGQIAAHLNESDDGIGKVLTDLRESGFIDVLSVGQLEAHSMPAAAYWRLTDSGRAELARLRSS